MTGIVKNIFRNIVAPGIVLSGLGKNIFSKNRNLILNYHGVIPTNSDLYNGRHLLLSNFEKQLLYFKRNFQIVSVNQIFENYRNHLLTEKPTIAITFDDGFLNNYKYAFPLLAKYQIQASIYISTICLDNPNFILWAEVVNILRKHIKSDIKIDKYNFKRIVNYDFYDETYRISISDYIKKLKSVERETFIDNMKQKYDFDKIISHINEDYWMLVNSDQIKRLADSGLIEIGSHSIHHYNLANIEPSIMEEELYLSKKMLESCIQKDVISIAYPDSSYNRIVKEKSIAIGYRNLCAVNYQLPEDVDDKSILPRFGVSATTNYYSNIFFINKAFNKLGF